MSDLITTAMNWQRRATAAESQVAELERELLKCQEWGRGGWEQRQAMYDRATAAESQLAELRELNRTSTRQALEEIGRLRGALEEAYQWIADCGGGCVGMPDHGDDYCDETTEAVANWCVPCRASIKHALASRVTVEVEQQPGDDVPPCARCGKDPRDLSPCDPQPTDTADGEGVGNGD